MVCVCGGGGAPSILGVEETRRFERNRGGREVIMPQAR